MNRVLISIVYGVFRVVVSGAGVLGDIKDDDAGGLHVGNVNDIAVVGGGPNGGR